MSETATARPGGRSGTSAAVVVLGAGAHDDARAAVEAELAEFDAACSRFREDSELSRVNDVAAATDTVRQCSAAGTPVRGSIT